MNETTRNVLDETMARDWTEIWPVLPPANLHFHGTAAQAVADFEARHGLTLRSHRLVMDDGDWTIRGTFADGSVATVFVA
jgi:GH35 family endo-1,4-beta-xylanase